MNRKQFDGSTGRLLETTDGEKAKTRKQARSSQMNSTSVGSTFDKQSITSTSPKPFQGANDSIESPSKSSNSTNSNVDLVTDSKPSESAIPIPLDEMIERLRLSFKCQDSDISEDEFDDKSDEEPLFKRVGDEEQSHEKVNRRKFTRAKYTKFKESEEDEPINEEHFKCSYESDEFKKTLESVFNENKEKDYMQHLRKRDAQSSTPARQRSDRGGLIQVFIVVIIAVIAMKFLVGVKPNKQEPGMPSSDRI